jgi:hypothetical protein
MLAGIELLMPLPSFPVSDVRGKAPADSRWLRTAVARVRFPTSLCDIFDTQSSIGTGISRCTSAPPVSILSPILHTYLHVNTNLIGRRKWRRHSASAYISVVSDIGERHCTERCHFFLSIFEVSMQTTKNKVHFPSYKHQIAFFV